MYILGLATMGASAACLFRDGTLIAAVEEERLSRIKNDGAFPSRAIAECLRIAGIGIGDVHEIAVYWQPWRLRRRVLGTLGKGLGGADAMRGVASRVNAFFLRRAPDAARPEDGGSWRHLFRLRAMIAREIGPTRARIRFHDHHASHQRYAEAMIDPGELISLSYDGGGESASTVVTVVGEGGRKRVSTHDWPNSLGHFYSTFTGYLGFRMLEGEYKMMGLAPYGTPRWKEALLEHVLKLEPGGRYRLDTRLCDYHAALQGRFPARLAELFCAPRAPDETPSTDHIDLAASVQAAQEAVLDHILAPLRDSHPQIRRLVVSGGCALNVTANGKLIESGRFDRVAIPPAPHDAGCAIGAAMLSLPTGVDTVSLRSPYLGAGFTAAEIEEALAPHLLRLPEPLSDEDLVEQVAALLEEGRIVAWFQGRAEFGPRALGARSFLADPRRDEIREDINAKIKKRELFRPFAPSVTEEAAADFFEIDQPSPYMNIVSKVRPARRSEIPAVTHTDGTARVHAVPRAANPLYHALLSEFGRRSGVPVLLNTSFNIQEPIVYDPGQALATFRASGVDALAIGPYLVTRDMLA